AGLPEPARVVGRDREAGRLLEPFGGEEHAVGEVAELLAGLRAQPRLGERGGDELGVEAFRAQPLGDRHRGVRVVRRERPEERPAPGAEQLAETARIHAPDPCTERLCGQRGRTGRTRALWLALTLTEC